MTTQRRDLIILATLFGALLVFSVFGPLQEDDDNFNTTMTTYSSRPGGAMALLRWAEAMGYDAARLEYSDFELGPEVDVLFMLNPSEPVNRTSAAEVLRWVETGGTLILVEDQPGLFRARNALLPELEVEIARYDGEEDMLHEAPPLQPVLDDPPLAAVPVEAERVLLVERTDVARLVGTDDATVLLGMQRGAGYVYVSSAAYPFTNEGLRDEDSAALLLNLLRGVSPGGRVLFDEIHHGFFTPPALRALVFESAWGRALLYSLGLLALYMILTGRRFGQPVPLREEVARRSSAEYVESMADLLQRGGQRGFVLAHYHTSTKRRLAQPFGLNPHLDDADFVAQLAHFRAIDQAHLLEVLRSLRNAQASEATLLRAVAAADAIPTRS